MHFKNSKNELNNDHLVAGLMQNDNIEFYGIKPTKEVRFLMNGRTYQFKSLPKEAFALLCNAYHSDRAAMEILKEKADTTTRRVELYTYFMYGDLTNSADIINSELQPNENYRHKRNCISKRFDNKRFRVNGQELNHRDISIIDMIAMDELDTEIARSLGITTSTLGFHKKNLLVKLDSQTKTSLLYKAMRDKLIH